MNGSLSLLHEREEIMARVIRVKYWSCWHGLIKFYPTKISDGRPFPWQNI
jgi:hypothetical protein